MSKIVKAVGIALITLISLVLLGVSLLEIRWRHDLIAKGSGRFLDTTAQALELQFRKTVPIGSSLSAAEQTLQSEGFRFTYDAPSQTILAGAGYLKGSTFLISEGIYFKLHLDKSGRVTRIESRVDHTGP